MKSIAFPEMFNKSKTLVVSDHDATFQNLSLMLKSAVGSLFGDPGFGTKLGQVLYSQSNVGLQDFIADEIYTAIKLFVPQLIVSRKNITIVRTNLSVTAQIIAVNMIDYETDMYNIKLIQTEGE